MSNRFKHQSKIEKLVAELCPNGVEFKELANLAKITTGKLNANAMKEDGQYPFFTCAEKPFLIDNYAFDTEAILISGNGSQVGHINYYKGKFNAYQRTYVLSDFSNKTNVQFLLFCLRGFLKEYILKNVKEGSVPYITLPMLQDFIIPLPPVAIQEEIVKILDSFTELEAELEARKKQYGHYRSEILTLGEGVVFERLGEICEIADNKRKPVASSLRIAGKIPYYGANNIQDYVNGFTHDGDFVLIAEDGSASLENYSIQFAIGKFWANNHVHVVRGLDKLNNRFLFHYLKNMSFVPFLTDGTRAKLTKGKMIEIKIPVPVLAEQNRIVSILDKFDALVNDISIGLPAEILARKQQYEYYRGKLLNFKELQAG